MTIITLTTDFGQADGYVGIMKGVILGIAPDARLVDLSHEIAPQDVRSAAFVLGRAIPYFPAGTIHLAVVDPGVGSSRRALVVQTTAALFVGPDNGLFSRPLGQPEARAFAADKPDYWLPHVSQTFHGRDVFAPLAAHLAAGAPVEALGSRIHNPVLFDDPAPIRRAYGSSITGRVVYVDRFGNLITNVPGAWLAGSQWTCRINGQAIRRLSQAYAVVPSGTLLALVSSQETLEIAVRDGSAAGRLDAGIGEVVELTKEEG